MYDDQFDEWSAGSHGNIRKKLTASNADGDLRYVPVEQLALSPQCGFASVIAGNRLSEEEQWRKIELMLEVAERVWG